MQKIIFKIGSPCQGNGSGKIENMRKKEGHSDFRS